MQTTAQTKKSFYKTVAALVVPMALQNLINVGVQSADVFMLSQVGETVLAASSLAGQVQFVMMLFFFGISSGALVLTAQYWGKGDTRTIEKLLSIALRISVGVALLFFAAATLIPATLMRIFTPDTEIIALGVQYLRFVAPSYLIIAFTNIYLNIMRSVEKVMVATVVYFISLVANVFLNAGFIFGYFGFPAMGIAGAALATTLARVLELVIVIVYAVRNQVIRLRMKDFTRMHPALLKDFIKYALPTILNELFWGLGMSTVAVIIGHLGSAATAANSVAQVMRQLATVVSFGVANAAAILVGKAIGAGSKEDAQYNASRLVRLSLLTGVFGGGVILILRSVVIRVMQLSPLAKDYLGFLLLIMAFYAVAQAYAAVLIVGVFRGGGDPRFGLFLDIGVMWGVSILWGFLGAFVFHWPVKVVFAVILVDEFIKVPLATLRYKSKRWLRNVTRVQQADS